ncbi:MAG: nitroreductase family protein [Kiritimatiellae bacterium]|nr:nitroreductase family protein [Kiritimatiellia bacterium]MDD3544291.1 nitroreductase family protein [Kiritimatiellia bacterium]MDD4026262.1 nitroreductase family protein [Kiritimatiellia bacterium]MDD4622133.1 nitroreductase family protein [Kiritimatiellia bacterium]
MNHKLDFIWTRRSVRAFIPEPVAEDDVQAMLEAAMAAPSACCRDPWAFIVLRQAPARKAVAACLPNGGFLADAPLGIIVCGSQKRAHAESLSYLLQDCSAAIENILLAANALGLGSCWLGIHPREERIAALHEALDFPSDCLPVGAIAIGRPASRPEPRTRFDAAKVYDGDVILKP